MIIFAKRSKIKNGCFFTGLKFYLYIRIHILTLMTFINVFIMFVFLYYKIVKTYFLIRFLIGCHILRELSVKLLLYLEHYI
jgi:hypothetical protein